MYQKQHVLYYAITSPSIGIGRNVLMPKVAMIIVILPQAVDTLTGINKPDQCMPTFTTIAKRYRNKPTIVLNRWPQRDRRTVVQKKKRHSDKAFDGLRGFLSSIEQQRKDDLINESVL